MDNLEALAARAKDAKSQIDVWAHGDVGDENRANNALICLEKNRETIDLVFKLYDTFIKDTQNGLRMVPEDTGARLGEEFLKPLFSSEFDTPYIDRLNSVIAAAPISNTQKVLEGGEYV